jgi:REP element-mobilizing transposase RayT
LLIPRLPQHYLIADLSARLSKWTAQLCLAFGWRLEYQAIRPQSLQWIASLPPNIPAETMIQVMRRQTSQRIFATYAHLRDENPSGDFWAPGYIVVSSFQPLPNQVVQEFIQQVRKRQGVSRRGRPSE